MIGNINLGCFENEVNVEFPHSSHLMPPRKIQELEDKLNEIINTVNLADYTSFTPVVLAESEANEVNFAQDRADVNYLPFAVYLDDDGNLQPYRVYDRQLGGFKVSTTISGTFLYFIIQLPG